MPGVCRYFLQGTCRYGSSCRFEHPGGQNTGYAYSAQRQLFGGGGGGRGVGGGRGGGGGGRYQQNQNQYKWQASDYNNQRSSNMNQQSNPNDIIDILKSEMNEWDDNKMWPFSCVGFEKDCPCIPDFVDHSPEELRSTAYEAQKSGNFQAYIQHERGLFEEYRQKRQQLKNITMTLKQKLNSLIDDYRNKKKRSSAQGSNASSLFSSSGSAFGASSSSQIGATGSSFGNQGQFGASSNQSAFGASNNQSAFGGSNNQNAFGASNNQSVFGASNNQSVFGASPFGTGSQIGSSPLTSGASQAFGQGSNATQSGFPSATQTPSVFGASNEPQPTGLFGKPVNDTNQTQTTGLFGKPSTSPASNLFGGFTATSNNSFASAGASPSAFPSVSSSPGGPFSGAGPSTSFPSGATAGAASGGNDKKYTPIDQLTPEELEAFQATKFTLGRIPTKPPPKELV